MNFGDKLKQIRIKKNLTQEELAIRCDLSKGFISQVERDLTSPSIATLIDILECLGTDLKHFFNDNENDKIVFTRDDMFIAQNTDYGFDIRWLVTNAQKNKMEPALIHLSPEGRSEQYQPSEGEVFGYVISGGVILNLGDKKNRVKKGESFYFKANQPYYLQNNVKAETSVIWVSSPPCF